MRKLLWTFLMLAQCDLWAASMEEHPCVGGPGPAVAAAYERPDSPDDYKFSTLAEAVEFCKSIAQDNILWLEGLHEYWAREENMKAVTESLLKSFLPTNKPFDINLLVTQMIKGYVGEKEDWEKLLGNADVLLADPEDTDGMAKFLNQTIEDIRVRKKDLMCLQYGASNPKAYNPGHLYPGNLENTEAQLESLETIFKTLFPFSTSEYKADYAEADFKYLGTGRTDGKRYHVDLGVSEKFESDGKYFTIVTPSGQQVRLSLEKELSCVPTEFCEAALFAMGIVQKIGELKIKFIASKLEFFLNVLPVGRAAKYKKSYMEAKAAYEAEVMAAKAEAALLEEKPAILSKNARKAAAKKAEAEREAAAALEAARAAEMAAASKAALAAEREHLKRVTLGLAAAQKPLPSLEHALGAAATESVPPTHSEPIGSTPLKPELQSMLSDLILRAVPVRTYNWRHLTNLLSDLGFRRQNNNFVGSDTAGKRKQIGLHYLHNKGGSLNPDLVHIMFQQLHGSVGLGRGALGRLAGIAEPLDPWSWESDRRG